MPILLIAVTLLVDIADFVELFWRSPRDPTWETRWRTLDPTESSWLAYMASAPNWVGTLTDPDEIELAKGFMRQEKRRRIYIDLLVASPLAITAALLVLAGALPVGGVGVILGAFAVFRPLEVFRRERQIKKTYEKTKATYQAITTSEPAPTV
ncbi:MAG TPA: hypothetical protein VMF55_01000 [Solirubrobacterales bacterium]|nr:hypothetical protein [Solirubrobacterales bacterium]